MKIRPCCEAFENLMSYAGEKGMAIVPRVRDGHRQFYIQARPFERSSVATLSAIDPTTITNKWQVLEAASGQIAPFVTVLTLPLKCCPSCGNILQFIIDNDIEAFDETAKDTAYLWRE